MSKKSHYYFWGAGVLIGIVVLPLIVNTLMYFRVERFPARGNLSTWITFFGSYLGSVVAGLATIVGVYLTIRFTQSQNKELLEFTRKESQRERLPDMIHNLQECLDILECVKGKMEKTKNQGMKRNPSNDATNENLLLYYLDSELRLSKKESYNDLNKTYPQQVRNYTVKVDAFAYEVFLQLSKNLDTAYEKHMPTFEAEYKDFLERIIKSHKIFDIHGNKLRNMYLFEGRLISEERNSLKILRKELYSKDNEYFNEIFKVYEAVTEKLEGHLLYLINDFNEVSNEVKEKNQRNLK